MTIDLQFLAFLVAGVAGIRLGMILYRRWRGREVPGQPFSRVRVVCLGLIVISMVIVALEL